MTETGRHMAAFYCQHGTRRSSNNATADCYDTSSRVGCQSPVSWVSTAFSRPCSERRLRLQVAEVVTVAGDKLCQGSRRARLSHTASLQSPSGGALDVSQTSSCSPNAIHHPVACSEGVFCNTMEASVGSVRVMSGGFTMPVHALLTASILWRADSSTDWRSKTVDGKYSTGRAIC